MLYICLVWIRIFSLFSSRLMSLWREINWIWLGRLRRKRVLCIYVLDIKIWLFLSIYKKGITTWMLWIRRIRVLCIWLFRLLRKSFIWSCLRIRMWMWVWEMWRASCLYIMLWRILIYWLCIICWNIILRSKLGIMSIRVFWIFVFRSSSLRELLRF